MITIPGIDRTFADQADLASFIATLPAEKQQAIADQLSGVSTPLWEPQPGPQKLAYDSTADYTFYGGQAGGGKTDLAIGLALTKYTKTLFLRREFAQFTSIIERIADILPSGRQGYNGSTGTWNLTTPDGVQRVIHFRGMADPNSHLKLQGQDHPLVVWDEVGQARLYQLRYVLGWLRSTNPEVEHCRFLGTFNPPQDREGLWMLQGGWLGPWLNQRYEGERAESGQLRWFNTQAGIDIEVPSSDPVTLEDGTHVDPMSVTFVRAKLEDNTFLPASYRSNLNALPEPLRSQLLHGAMWDGIGSDSPQQIIPSEWVEQAMKRWEDAGGDRDIKGELMAIGCDVARGGRDQTIIWRRYDSGLTGEGPWIAPAITYEGTETPDGNTVAGFVMKHIEDGAPVIIDAVGVGSSPYDRLVELGQHTHGHIGSRKTGGLTQNGQLSFNIAKAEAWWRLREILDPSSGVNLMLPRDNALFSDLIAMEWKLQSDKIVVSTKKEVIDLLGRSPDRGDALTLVMMEIPKLDWEDVPRLDQPAMVERVTHVEPEFTIGADGQYSKEIKEPGRFQSHNRMLPRRRRRMNDNQLTDEQLDYNPYA